MVHHNESMGLQTRANHHKSMCAPQHHLRDPPGSQLTKGYEIWCKVGSTDSGKAPNIPTLYKAYITIDAKIVDVCVHVYLLGTVHGNYK